ncbi:hypothetical protein FRB96_008449 [Tulasnella sp. 330]|nr:hypothetical protein FRB96_008449 [Tulasnella sp. 330]
MGQIPPGLAPQVAGSCSPSGWTCHGSYGDKSSLDLTRTKTPVQWNAAGLYCQYRVDASESQVYVTAYKPDGTIMWSGLQTKPTQQPADGSKPWTKPVCCGANCGDQSSQLVTLEIEAAMAANNCLGTTITNSNSQLAQQKALDQAAIASAVAAQASADAATVASSVSSAIAAQRTADMSVIADALKNQTQINQEAMQAALKRQHEADTSQSGAPTIDQSVAIAKAVAKATLDAQKDMQDQIDAAVAKAKLSDQYAQQIAINTAVAKALADYQASHPDDTTIDPARGSGGRLASQVVAPSGVTLGPIPGVDSQMDTSQIVGLGQKSNGLSDENGQSRTKSRSPIKSSDQDAPTTSASTESGRQTAPVSAHESTGDTLSSSTDQRSPRENFDAASSYQQASSPTTSDPYMTTKRMRKVKKVPAADTTDEVSATSGAASSYR